jgi:hypothetical protein
VRVVGVAFGFQQSDVLVVVIISFSVSCNALSFLIGYKSGCLVSKNKGYKSYCEVIIVLNGNGI